ncbi:hypothetical protein MJO28_010983 [Puccinia striiformis f. sp. tritici]|uniref:Uncharacterized protein n=1 Tax=Puccinia striiformis f. sp. tritici TaxID=168172 RepID=A0ACC0E0V1_9BASI|nr:hypothetical protein MJO28_010983 [Puccinia striiformis f. sp. tritici]
MPSSNQITCHLVHGSDPANRFPELLPNITSDGSATCYIPVETNPNPSPDYGSTDLPYSVHWSIDPSLLADGGVQVQIQVDGCQKGQPRCYEGIGPDGLTPPTPISGMDDGLWVVPDGTRRRPWVMGEIKTTHPHSALADKYILGRVGSVSVTFSRANIVPTSRAVALTPVFSGSAPLPDRMREKISHWTRLGFIENHPPGTELGLVADEVDEVIAHFTFYYRSKEMLQRLLPTGFSSETKISFPTEPRTQDERSIQSTEDLDGGRGQAKSGGFEGNRASVLRRAFGTNNSPRHSINGSLPTPLLGSEQDEFGKLGKFGGKRVRAVSLRLSKRLSSTGAKPDEKNPLSTPEVTSPDSPASNHEDLNTMQGLRNEVIQLRLELNELKKHLQPS